MIKVLEFLECTCSQKKLIQAENPNLKNNQTRCKDNQWKIGMKIAANLKKYKLHHFVPNFFVFT